MLMYRIGHIVQLVKIGLRMWRERGVGGKIIGMPLACLEGRRRRKRAPTILPTTYK